MKLETITDDEWADVVARQLTGVVPGARLSLPTGSTPRPVYARVDADWSASTVFLLDEFLGLPPGDPGRCDSMIERDLLARLDPRPAIERLDPDAVDLDRECRRFAASVADGGLDLCVLGLGANGHIGLNEPGTPVDAPTRVVEIAETTAHAVTDRYGASSAPNRGMTLGMAEIMAADEVWLLVTGGHKAEVLQRVLDGPIGPEVPASWLRRHPRAVVWADESAAHGG